MIQPWCDKINKESNDRLKCQIYPAMQLGGTPPQLFDQVRDGVVDIVWTVPTYSAGRFSKSEVFELPFMAHTAKGGSQAFWQYVQKNAHRRIQGRQGRSCCTSTTGRCCTSPTSSPRRWKT